MSDFDALHRSRHGHIGTRIVVSQQDTTKRSQSPVPPRKAPPRPLLRRGMIQYLLILAVSALVYCGLIVFRRDAKVKEAALVDARQVRASLADALRTQGFLPPRLPNEDSLPISHQDLIPYPRPEQVRRLREHDGPYILWCSPRNGRILPGADGHAAVEFHDGELNLRWLSISAAREAREQRSVLTQPAGR